MMARKIHHPHALVTNVHAPVVVYSRPASTTLPRFRFQQALARQAKAMTRVRKMIKKTMLVRGEQIRQMKHMRPMVRKKGGIC